LRKSRARKNITLEEPVEFARIAITIPEDVLGQLDVAARLYGQARSTIIQKACKDVAEDLVGLDWLKEIFQQKEVRSGSDGYDVSKIISRVFEWAPAASDNSFYLTPSHLEFIKQELEQAKESKKNKWIEFCKKCKLDTEKLPKDKVVRCFPPEELIEI
jgi:hypothetical protein